MTDTPCRVSADLRAYQLREDRAPDEICDRCGASLFSDRRNTKWQPSDENWLVCPCGNALCEECVIYLGEITEWCCHPFVYRDGDERFTRLESVHNLGFCCPGCLAAAYEAARKEIRTWIVESSKAGLAGLMLHVRAVCNPESGK